MKVTTTEASAEGAEGEDEVKGKGKRRKRTRRFREENALGKRYTNLYDLAKDLTLKYGFAYTDPRTGETTQPK